MALKLKIGRLSGPLYNCEWCSFTSRSWNLFEQHLNRCQQRSAADAKTKTKKADSGKRKRNYRCDSCDFHAPRPKTLLLHVKEAHKPDLEIYSCELCNYASRFKKKITQHKKVAHPDTLLGGSGTSSDIEDKGVSYLETATVDADQECGGGDKSDVKSSTKKRKLDVEIEQDVSSAGSSKKLIKRIKLGNALPQVTQAGDYIASSPASGVSTGTSKISISLKMNVLGKESNAKSKPVKTGKKKGKTKASARVAPSVLKLITRDASMKVNSDGSSSKIHRYKCQLCSFIHSRKLSVAKHLQGIHGHKIGHFCKTCDFIGKTKSDLVKHASVHGKRERNCPDCLYSTAAEKKFLKHRECHVVSGLYSCHLCSFSSNSEPSVLSHKKDHHIELDSPAGNPIPDSFIPETLERNSPVDTKPSVFSCDYCSTEFLSDADLIQHISIAHSGGKMFKCAACPATYKSRSYLNIHSKQKHGTSLAKRRRSKLELDDKDPIQDGDGSELLPKLEDTSEFDEGVVVKEEDTAEEQKPQTESELKCNRRDISDERVVTDLNIAQDQMQKQPEVLVLVDGSKVVYRCTACSSEHPNRNGIEMHMCRIHPGSLFYFCPFCSFSCLFRLAMMNHFRSHRTILKITENLKDLLEQSDILSKQKNQAIPNEEKITKREAEVEPKALVEECPKLKVSGRKGSFKLKRAASTSTVDVKCVDVKTEDSEKLEEKPLDVKSKKTTSKLYCEVCDVFCDSTVTLARHQERHANLKRFMCSECGVRSNYDFYIRNHTQKNHEPGVARLTVLSKEDARKTIKSYNQKARTSQGGKSSSDQFVAPTNDEEGDSKFCGEKFEDDVDVDVCSVINVAEPEMTTDSPALIGGRNRTLKWTCDKCTYATDSPAKLSGHKEVHENLKRFMCPVCGKRSNWSPYIQAHIKKAHRSSKSEMIELSHGVARNTIADYMNESSKTASPLKSKKSQSNKNAGRKSSVKKAETNKPKGSTACSIEEEQLPAQEFSTEENLQKGTKQVISDSSFAALPEVDFDLDSSEPPGNASYSPNTKNDKNELCKRYKCSVCGMRTNWTAALWKHRQVWHPHARTITLPIKEAKATLEIYDSKLKYMISLSNTQSKLDAVDESETTKSNSVEQLTKSQSPKQLKVTNALTTFCCSQCKYKSKWKSYVKKHIVGVHPTAKVTKIDNLQSEEKLSFKNKMEYSCSECGHKTKLLIALKKHISTVHPAASVLRNCGCDSDMNSFLPSGSATGSTWLPETGRYPASVASTSKQNEISSSEKPCADLIDFTGSHSIAFPNETFVNGLPNLQKFSGFKSEDSSTLKPRNFACSGCSYRSNRRRHVLRHIRTHHQKRNCHVIHLRSQARGINSKQRESVRLKVSLGDSQKAIVDSADAGTENMSCEPANGSATSSSHVFYCDVCPYRAFRNNQLLRHKKLHKEKPGYTFECIYCPYFCASSYLLQKHLLLHKSDAGKDGKMDALNDHAYSQVLPFANKKGKYDCDKCPFTSGNCQNFLYHKQFHRPRPSAAYKCDVCPFWVPDKKMMVQHAKLHEVSLRPLGLQNEDAGILDDVVETARVKWDIIAAACVPSAEKKQNPGPTEVKSNDIGEGKGVRNRTSSPRSLAGQKSFTEMWLNGSLTGQNDENIADAFGADSLSLKSAPAPEEQAKNGRSKENELDRVDRGSVSNGSAELALPSTRSWHCEKCPYLTVMLTHFKRHMSLHGSRQRYECLYCDYSVPCFYLLQRHRKLHFAPNRNLIFSQPMSAFQSVTPFGDGAEEFLKEITFVPTADNMSFYEDSTEFRVPSKLFRCDACPYSTLWHKSWVAHQKRHTIVSAFTCPYCTYSVSDQRYLNLHVFEHFNLPGTEMNEFSAAEAPELLETMKTEILKVSFPSVSGKTPVSSTVSECLRNSDGCTLAGESQRDFKQETSVQLSSNEQWNSERMSYNDSALMIETDIVPRRNRGALIHNGFMQSESPRKSQPDFVKCASRAVPDDESIHQGSVIVYPKDGSMGSSSSQLAEQRHTSTTININSNFNQDVMKTGVSSLATEDQRNLSDNLKSEKNSVVCVIDSPILGNLVVTSCCESDSFSASETQPIPANQKDAAIRKDGCSRLRLDEDDPVEEDDLSILLISDSDSEEEQSACPKSVKREEKISSGNEWGGCGSAENDSSEQVGLPEMDLVMKQEPSDVMGMFFGEEDDIYIEINSEAEQEANESTRS